MLASFSIHRHWSKPDPSHTDHFSSNNLIGWRNSVLVCCVRNKYGDQTQNYYELLGISADASSQEIKDVYRKLQKKHHPDIAGQKGHERTLMINKAYKVLTSDLRKEYDASIAGRLSVSSGSIWKGPLRPEALFVDENACIGCRECVYHASNTFMMDEALGKARVQVQYGDDDGKIEISVDSCPVNCIHWVDTEDLAVLEHLIQPQQKSGHGIYGQGWERTANVFMAAKSFNKQLNRQEENQSRHEKSTDEDETPAQAEARARAYREIEIQGFAKFWNWVKKT